MAFYKWIPNQNTKCDFGSTNLSFQKASRAWSSECVLLFSTILMITFTKGVGLASTHSPHSWGPSLLTLYIWYSEDFFKLFPILSPTIKVYFPRLQVTGLLHKTWLSSRSDSQEETFLLSVREQVGTCTHCSDLHKARGERHLPQEWWTDILLGILLHTGEEQDCLLDTKGSSFQDWNTLDQTPTEPPWCSVPTLLFPWHHTLSLC